jgi:hypothetical protein
MFTVIQSRQGGNDALAFSFTRHVYHDAIDVKLGDFQRADDFGDWDVRLHRRHSQVTQLLGKCFRAHTSRSRKSSQILAVAH